MRDKQPDPHNIHAGVLRCKGERRRCHARRWWAWALRMLRAGRVAA